MTRQPAPGQMDLTTLAIMLSAIRHDVEVNGYCADASHYSLTP